MDGSFWKDPGTLAFLLLLMIFALTVFSMFKGLIFAKKSLQEHSKMLKDRSDEAPDQTTSAELMREARTYDRNWTWMGFIFQMLVATVVLLFTIAGTLILVFS